MCLAKKYKEALRRSTRLPTRGDVEAAEANGSLSEESLLDMDYWTSQTSNANSKPGIRCVDLVTLAMTGISVSALRWVRLSFHQASTRFNHNTVIYVCVLEVLALCNYFTVEHLKQNDALDKKFQIEHHRWPERKKKGAEKEEEGV